jgi:hypothetical protein
MATKPVVQIDGKNFVAVPQGRSERVVRRLRNEDFISQFSGEGIRSPSTFLGYQTLIFPNFSLGLGRERIDSDSARVSGEYRRFWDATCDTRFASGVYLPILEEDSTSTGLEVIRASTAFKGNLWGIWQDDSSRSVVARKYDADDDPMWEAGGNILKGLEVQTVASGTVGGVGIQTIALDFTGARAGVLVGVMQDLAGAYPTGVTWNSNAMSLLGSQASTGRARVSLWGLANDDDGAHNVVITWSGGDVTSAASFAIGFSGVHQTSPFGSVTGGAADDAAPTINVASIADDIVVDALGIVDVSGGLVAATVHGSQTQRLNDDSGSLRAAASTETATGTTTTMSWGLDSDEEWALAGVAVKPELTAALDIFPVRTHLLALLAIDDGIHVYRSTDGATWAPSTTDELGSSVLANDVAAHENIDAGLLSEIGGEAVATIWDEDSATITFFSSTNAGDNWTDEAVDISSGNGPQGVAVLAGIDNEDKLYIGTREGLHEVDTAPSTWTTRLVFSMIGNNDNCRRMKVMDDGALWFAQGVDDDTPPIVYRMFVSNGARVIERVPNDFSLGDGLTSDALGPIRWMIAADGMVYASAGGGKSARNARIWCHNGKGWHSVRKHGTVNQKIEWIAASSDDDGTPRLHYAVRTATAAHDVNFLGQAFVNPASGITIKRETPGFVDLPYVDLSFPLDTKNWLRVGVNADTLTAATTHQHINMDYGITSNLGTLAARNAGDLGDILSGTSRLPFKTTVLGVSQEVGASGLVLGLRANMLLGSNPAANTVKPVLKDIQIDALPKPTKTRRFEVIVDIADTAALRGGANATAAIYTDLETIEDLKVKAAVTYADIGTKYMDVEAVHYDDEIIGHSATGGPDSNARRGGTAQIILSEVAI